MSAATVVVKCCRTCRNQPKAWTRVEIIGLGVKHEGYCRRRKVWIIPEDRSGCGQWAACPTASEEGAK